MTIRQREVLDFITSYIGMHGFSPSYEEIGFALKLRSVATIHNHVRNLKRDGYVNWRKNSRRSLRLSGSCPMCGAPRKVKQA